LFANRICILVGICIVTTSVEGQLEIFCDEDQLSEDFWMVFLPTNVLRADFGLKASYSADNGKYISIARIS